MVAHIGRSRDGPGMTMDEAPLIVSVGLWGNERMPQKNGKLTN